MSCAPLARVSRGPRGLPGVTAGLTEDYRVIGGHMVTVLAARWQLGHELVWLHTSTLDHPRALPNYHRRGFRTFKTEQGERG
jgi:hypothetical protein